MQLLSVFWAQGTLKMGATHQEGNAFGASSCS